MYIWNIFHGRANVGLEFVSLIKSIIKRAGFVFYKRGFDKYHQRRVLLASKYGSITA
jgi:hypothetical protein